MLNVNNQLKKIKLFKNSCFSAESLRSTRVNTSQSLSNTASKSTAGRETEIKSLNLPRGKFKTDP